MALNRVNPWLYNLRDHLRTPLLVWKNVSWRRPATCSPRRHVFVVGAPRSGTTLVQRILACHPDFFSIEGETGLFSRQNIFTRRHFGFTMPECEELFGRARDTVGFFDLAVDRLRERGCTGTFVEKTPQHLLHLSFLLRHFPQSLFVHVMRDGRDAYCSAREYANIPQGRSVAAYARYWRRCLLARQAAGNHPHVLDFRYEQLCSDPEAGVRSLMSFLGAESSKLQLDPLVLGRDHRAGQAAFTRLAEPINARSVGRWRSGLSAAEVAAFNAVAGAELSANGYEI
jgi:protein-tyrosine sulfotransferase